MAPSENDFDTPALKTPPKKLLDLINEFSKVGYKINIQKSAFLYTNNELSERETKKTISFTIAKKNKNNKIPRNKLNKVGKRLVLGKL